MDHHGPEHLRELCRDKREKTHVSRNRGVFTGKVKTEVKQTPATMRWKLKRDKSLQPSVSGHCLQHSHRAGQGRVLAQQLFALLSDFNPTPPIQQSCVELAAPRRCTHSTVLCQLSPERPPVLLPPTLPG